MQPSSQITTGDPLHDLSLYTSASDLYGNNIGLTNHRTTGWMSNPSLQTPFAMSSLPSSQVTSGDPFHGLSPYTTSAFEFYGNHNIGLTNQHGFNDPRRVGRLPFNPAMQAAAAPPMAMAAHAPPIAAPGGIGGPDGAAQVAQPYGPLQPHLGQLAALGQPLVPAVLPAPPVPGPPAPPPNPNDIYNIADIQGIQRPTHRGIELALRLLHQDFDLNSIDDATKALLANFDFQAKNSWLQIDVTPLFTTTINLAMTHAMRCTPILVMGCCHCHELLSPMFLTRQSSTKYP
jgi:hypothetical protein